MDGHVLVHGALFGVIVLLLSLLVYQQWFYSRQVQSLVERLMARSIEEFERAKNPPPPRIRIKEEPVVESFDRVYG